MLREGSFALAAFGRIRKVHKTAFPSAFPVVFAAAFGRKSVARKRMFHAAFASTSFLGEATFADLMDDLRAMAFLSYPSSCLGTGVLEAPLRVQSAFGRFDVPPKRSGASQICGPKQELGTEKKGSFHRVTRVLAALRPVSGMTSSPMRVWLIRKLRAPPRTCGTCRTVIVQNPSGFLVGGSHSKLPYQCSLTRTCVMAILQNNSCSAVLLPLGIDDRDQSDHHCNHGNGPRSIPAQSISHRIPDHRSHTLPTWPSSPMPSFYRRQRQPHAVRQFRRVGPARREQGPPFRNANRASWWACVRHP